MVRLDEMVTNRIKKVLSEAGISGDEHIVVEQFKLSDMPQDAYLTEATLMRAEFEAQDLDCDYLCYICGKEYNDPDELILCFQEHVKQFMAGVPIPTTKEYLEKKKEQLNRPFNFREFMKKNNE
jgi:hypothetical protein